MGSYPWAWAEQNLGRGWHVLRGDIAWSIGQRAAAQRAYERATEIHETPDGWLRRGDAARAQGDYAAALSDYRQAMRLAPPYIPASARLGDLLRETGDLDKAHDAFEGEFADQQQVVDWAWQHLRPIPIDGLDVGDGLRLWLYRRRLPCRNDRGRDGALDQRAGDRAAGRHGRLGRLARG